MDAIRRRPGGWFFSRIWGGAAICHGLGWCAGHCRRDALAAAVGCIGVDWVARCAGGGGGGLLGVPPLERPGVGAPRVKSVLLVLVSWPSGRRRKPWARSPPAFTAWMPAPALNAITFPCPPAVPPITFPNDPASKSIPCPLFGIPNIPVGFVPMELLRTLKFCACPGPSSSPSRMPPELFPDTTFCSISPPVAPPAAQMPYSEFPSATLPSARMPM